MQSDGDLRQIAQRGGVDEAMDQPRTRGTSEERRSGDGLIDGGMG